MTETTPAVFRIAPDGLNKAALRSMKPMAFVLVIPVAVGIWIGSVLHTAAPLIGMLALFGFIGLITVPMRAKYMSLLRFEVRDKYILQTIDTEDSNFFIEMGRGRNQARGSKDEKSIVYREIENFYIKSNGTIVITAASNNFLTDNDKITIPPELENYETCKALLQEKTGRRFD